MRLIRDGAEVRVDERNEVIYERLLECTEVETAAPTGTAGTASSAIRGRRARSVGWTSAAAAKRIAAILHRNDERLCFSFGNQVVHDPPGMALTAPARF